jgi:hypothetical protein
MGASSYSCWKSNDRFKNIIEAISMCGLKDSLKEMSICNCNIKINEGKQILESYELGDIDLKAPISHTISQNSICSGTPSYLIPTY